MRGDREEVYDTARTHQIRKIAFQAHSHAEHQKIAENKEVRMSTRLKRWLPIGLCCLPGLAIAAIVGASVLLGGATFGVRLGGPLGVTILALAFLACPLSMGFMTWRSNRNASEGAGSGIAGCCPPAEKIVAVLDQSQVTSSSERLV